MTANHDLICVRCHKPVTVYKADYCTFEQMHWLCFHLEYEHDSDPDEPCGDPSCPRWHIEVYKRKLRQLGYDPQQVINEAIVERWQLH